MKLPVIHQLFARRTIAGQLTLLRNIVIAGFVVLALGYALAITIQGRTIALNADINEFRKTALEINAGMLQARRNEKDFMLRNEESYVAEHDKTMARLNHDVDRAITTAPDAQLRDLVLQLQKDLRQYDANFKKTVATQKTMGLDQNSGLHGTLREAVHKVEDEVVAQKLDALTISMLTMRRHEKDFIQRKDEEYVTQMAAEQSRFDSLLAKAKLPDYSKKAIAAQMSQYQAAFREYVAGIGQVAAAAEEMRNAVHLTEPVLDKLQGESAQRLATADAQLKATLGVLNAIYGGLLLLILMLVAGGLYVASMSVLRPLERLTNTVKRLAEGDHTARSLINDKNEFGQLGNAFDKMMEERVATQQAIERENTQLNDSVLNLLQAVAQLARKDLTIKVPVTEDVTGPVADALNLLTSETGKVLAEVTDISADVTSASLKVKEQTDTVSKVAATGRHEAEQTAESLAAAARSMGEIAGLAQECNTSAERAIRTTQEALQAVANTVGGINNARDTIRETEKRIKRLGERSQEISVAVNLINTIAERTHILALNASMHAASAGEAGRGFAVVADEVQRLAENARQATAQIAALVSNIQVETSDTVNTMNSAISQVVEGAKLAEQASERMHQTEAGTAELVALVRSIAADSRAQAQVSTELLQRAAEIRKSTEETSRKIEEAGQYTGHLVEYARNLLGAVRVFKLPA